MRKLGIFILSVAFSICATTYRNEKITAKVDRSAGFGGGGAAERAEGDGRN